MERGGAGGGGGGGKEGIEELEAPKGVQGGSILTLCGGGGGGGGGGVGGGAGAGGGGRAGMRRDEKVPLPIPSLGGAVGARFSQKFLCSV